MNYKNFAFLLHSIVCLIIWNRAIKLTSIFFLNDHQL